jgi:hypothetical protein
MVEWAVANCSPSLDDAEGYGQRVDMALWQNRHLRRVCCMLERPLNCPRTGLMGELPPFPWKPLLS